MMHGVVIEDPASAAGRCWERPGQSELQGAVVRRGQLGGRRHQRLPERIARRETPDARHRVA
jgi:hypothetical protein